MDRLGDRNVVSARARIHLYTAANVGPRAFANHRWYREQFENYLAERRALIPFLL